MTEFDLIEKTYNDSWEMHETHARLGRSAITKAFVLLESIPVVDKKVVISPQTAKHYEQLATRVRDLIAEGTRIESAARKELLKLAKEKPERIVK